MTAKRAGRIIDRVHEKQAATLAEKTRKFFPCTSKTDTAFIETGDWVELPCDTAYMVDTLTQVVKIKDNSFQVKRIKKDVFIKVPVKTFYITKTIEDSAKIKILTSAVTKVEKLKNRYVSLVWILTGAVIILLLLYIFRKI